MGRHTAGESASSQRQLSGTHVKSPRDVILKLGDVLKEFILRTRSWIWTKIQFEKC